MKRLILAATAMAALPLCATAASAQGVYIGPNGFGLDTGPQNHDYGIGPSHVVIREYQDLDGCTVRVIRDRWPDGDVDIHRISDC